MKDRNLQRPWKKRAVKKLLLNPCISRGLSDGARQFISPLKRLQFYALQLKRSVTEVSQMRRPIDRWLLIGSKFMLISIKKDRNIIFSVFSPQFESRQKIRFSFRLGFGWSELSGLIEDEDFI